MSMAIEDEIRTICNRAVADVTGALREGAIEVEAAADAAGNVLERARESVERVRGQEPPRPSLPRDAADPAARARQLAVARQAYRYADPPFLPPLVNVEGVPDGEALDGAYNAQLLPVIMDIAVNEVQAATEFFHDHPGKRANLAAIPAYLEQAAGRLGPTTLLKNLMSFLLDGQVARLASVDAYAGLHQTLPPPSMEQAHDDDWMFAYQRVAGANPTLIERIDALPDNFRVTDALFREVVGDTTTLAAAAGSGRLYLCDYRILDGLPGGEVFGLRKYLTAPLALFYWQPGGLGGGSLVPVAIQLAQSPDPETAPVFTPRDGVKWTIAKQFVQNADGIHLQAIAHLQHCHLTIEPIILPTMRQLAADHPIQVLLRPHFRFTISINASSRTSLVTPGGVVDSILSPALEEGTYELIRRAQRAWRFDSALPEAVFVARRVADPQLLPEFPFRDDTLLLWQALRRFVGAYLRLYYRTDGDVTEDPEVQAWVGELRSDRGPKLAGLDPFLDGSGRMVRIESLVDVVSYIVYLAGPQHASVNYSMYDFEGFIPSCSLSMWGPPPTASCPEDQGSYVARLAPVDIALYQSQFSYLLSKQKYDTLGRYPPGTFSDPRALELVDVFGKELAGIESTIIERNNQRRSPYTFQLPSRVPNSISI